MQDGIDYVMGTSPKSYGVTQLKFTSCSECTPDGEALFQYCVPASMEPPPLSWMGGETLADSAGALYHWAQTRHATSSHILLASVGHVAMSKCTGLGSIVTLRLGKKGFPNTGDHGSACHGPVLRVLPG